MAYGAEENWYQSGAPAGMADPYLQLVGRQTDRGAEQQRNLGDATADHQRAMGQIEHDAPKDALNAYYRGAEENRAQGNFDQTQRLRDTAETRSQGDYDQMQRLRDAQEGRAQGAYGQQQKEWGQANETYDTVTRPHNLNAGTEEALYREQMLTKDPKTGQTGYGHGLQNEITSSDLGLAGQRLSNQNTSGMISERGAREGRIAEDRQRDRFAFEADALSKMPEGEEKNAARANLEKRYGKIDPGYLNSMVNSAQYATNANRTSVANANELAKNLHPDFSAAQTEGQNLNAQIDDGKVLADSGKRYNQMGKFFPGQRGDEVTRDASGVLEKYGKHDLAQYIQKPYVPFGGERDERMNEAAVEYYKDVDRKLQDFMVKNSKFKNENFYQVLAARQGEVRNQIQRLSDGSDKGLVDTTRGQGHGNQDSSPAWDRQTPGITQANAANTQPVQPPRGGYSEEQMMSDGRVSPTGSGVDAQKIRALKAHLTQPRRAAPSHDPYGLLGGR